MWKEGVQEEKEMKILVPVKRVVDYNVRIRVKSDGSGVETSQVKMSVNPFDDIAVEEALRLREKGEATEVVVVSIGPPAAQDQIRSALAMGADRGILIGYEGRLETLAVAKILAGVVREESPDCVLLGKQAIDDDCAHVPSMLAGLLGWGQATFASRVEVRGAQIVVTREVDGGLETISLAKPCVISADLRLNEPRYRSLPQMMKANQKTITQKTPTDYGVEVAARLEVLKTSEPPKRGGGVMVASVDELLDKLHHEAGVL